MKTLPTSKELVRNVKRWTAKLQEHHWQAGKAWYKHANQLCQVLSSETEVPLKNVCGVCQCSLNNQPFNPELQTSHGYCEVCLEVALNNVGDKL